MACDTAEERAEAHYQRGVELLAAGEVDRALVEFRNVFRLNGDHTKARLAYAGVLRERGEMREAYGQYLRLVEQDPDSLEGRKQVAQLALSMGNLPDATTHANAAYGLARRSGRARPEGDRRLRDRHRPPRRRGNGQGGAGRGSRPKSPPT